MDTGRRASALVDEAYAALGEAIVDGRLRPGDRLRDVELAAHMGISRTPVREALQKLERIGLVEVAANRYTRVAALSDRARRDMREYAAHTIAGALRVCLSRLSDEHTAEIRERVDAMAAAPSSRAYVDALLAFYAQVCGCCSNVVFGKALAQTELVLRRNLDGWEPTNPDAFEALRAAVADRDSEAGAVAFLALHGFA